MGFLLQLNRIMQVKCVAHARHGRCTINPCCIQVDIVAYKYSACPANCELSKVATD